jgi:Ca2+-binding RTX toxin-like protein
MGHREYYRPLGLACFGFIFFITTIAGATTATFYGTTGSDCIYFGKVYKQLKAYPYTGSYFLGICVWDYGYCQDSNHFKQAQVASAGHDTYKVCGDQCVSNQGSADRIQIAYYSTLQFCGDDANAWYYISNDFPASHTAELLLFWGDGGNDTLDLCSTSSCSAYWDEVENRADGRDGDDTIWGTPLDDELWGGNQNDTISGRAGDDVIHGGNGNDDLYGDAGEDTIYGDGGADDDAWGGAHWDTCYVDDTCDCDECL